MEQKDNVKAFPNKEMSTREQVEQMEQEAIDAYLAKFGKALPQADSSAVEEEDDEEEVFTLDFDKNIATQKLGEGLIIKSSPSGEALIDPKSFTWNKNTEDANKINDMLKEIDLTYEPLKPTLQQKYQDMITNRFVSKAIASLIEKLNKSSIAAQDSFDQTKTIVGGDLAEEIHTLARRKIDELRFAIAGGTVHYDKIPSWAESYVEEYMFSSLNTLIDFVERD